MLSYGVEGWRGGYPSLELQAALVSLTSLGVAAVPLMPDAFY